MLSPFRNALHPSHVHDVHHAAGEGEQDMWPEDVHAAFIEALSIYPPTSVPHSQSRPKNEQDDSDQFAYKTLIQAFILQKTGRLETVQKISDHIGDSLSAVSQTQLRLHSPCQEVDTVIKSSHSFPAAHPDFDLLPSLHASQLHGSSISAVHPVTATASMSPPTRSTGDAPSMSRRRQALNRPTLNLQMDIPPPNFNPSLSRFLREASGTSSKASPNLNVATSLYSRPPMLTRTSSSSIGYCNPMTPANQHIQPLLTPPEIPRKINSRRNAVGRCWAPTPTEGVLPLISFENVTTSSATTGTGVTPDPPFENLTNAGMTGVATNSLSWMTRHAMFMDTPLLEKPCGVPLEVDASLASPLAIASVYNPFIPEDPPSSSE